MYIDENTKQMIFTIDDIEIGDSSHVLSDEDIMTFRINLAEEMTDAFNCAEYA